MAKFCTGCGKEIADGVAFCTECGTPAPADTPQEAPQPYTPPVQQTAPSPAATATAAPPRAAAVPAEAPPAGRNGIVGTGWFFGMMLLFAIPVIGWLVCLITAFASKNESKKHFARAMLIWLIIGLVLAVVGYFVFRWLGGAITDYINAEFGGQFGDLQELLEQFKQFENGGLIPPME